jgi:hypothetical protein
MFSIKDESGRVWNAPCDIGTAFVSFFQSLLSSARPSGVEECTHGIESKVTEEMNQNLTKIFTAMEVKQALDQMAPLKAPGPDGFSAEFYQQNWAIVGPEVCHAVLSFLNGAHMDGSINATNIALIPKKKNPLCVTDYRPISLCNVTYKLISKVLANRL